MAKKKEKAKRHPNHVYKAYKIEGDKATRLKKSCPKCGEGVFMAQHKNRSFCGKCHYAEFSAKKE
ncbi:30S ribosomal protein S27ae [candidate division KSB1 bacterium]